MKRFFSILILSFVMASTLLQAETMYSPISHSAIKAKYYQVRGPITYKGNSYKFDGWYDPMTGHGYGLVFDIFGNLLGTVLFKPVRPGGAIPTEPVANYETLIGDFDVEFTNPEGSLLDPSVYGELMVNIFNLMIETSNQ